MLAVGLVGTTGSVMATSITYNVNMSVQTALGNFHPGVDTVLVGGTFCNWTTTNVMTQTSDANVYTLTFNDTADAVGAYENHKFIIDPNGNSSGTSLNWESIGNRYFPVPATATNMAAVYFNDVSNTPSTTISITFQVDMQIAAIQGAFSPGSDYVDAFGSFNNWSTTGVLLTNVPGTTNYTGTFTTTALTTNTLVNYKYAIDGNGGTWEGNVGPSGAQNRSVTITNATQTFPLDYWDNITNANLSFNVGFQVNVAVEDAFGVFTPGGDTVFVNGDWNWNGYAVELTEVGSSDLYTGEVALAYSPGTTVNYKYTFDGGTTWENNGVGPGGAQNHQFTLNGTTNLPADNFNDYSTLGPVTINGPVSNSVISWVSGTNVNNRIQLQSASDLTAGNWSDVPNTQGQSSITNNFGSGPVYFRLTGP